ncbi:MAG: hypothetical protein ACTIBJ_14905 [Pseudomonas helleri]|uniref:hypothetical protein n=1 Tax=Pseudomonas helleri TaxID=1608996 RepID=UPI003F9AD407
MKRTAAVAGLCVFLAIGVQARELVVHDLGGSATPEEQKKGQAFMASQKAADEVPAAEAKAFIVRLDDSVRRAMKQAAAGEMNSVKIRNQAIELAKFQLEAERFGVLFTRFAKCRSAATDAAMSWQGVVWRDQKQLEDHYSLYQAESGACRDAASE